MRARSDSCRMLVGPSSNPATLFMSNAPHLKWLTGLLALSLLLVGSAATGCNDSAAGGSLRIAYVTNEVDGRLAVGEREHFLRMLPSVSPGDRRE